MSVNQRISMGWDGIHFAIPFLLHPLGMLGPVCCFSVFLFDHATGISFHWQLPACLSWAKTFFFCPLLRLAILQVPRQTMPCSERCASLIHTALDALTSERPCFFIHSRSCLHLFYQRLPTCVSSPSQRRRN